MSVNITTNFFSHDLFKLKNIRKILAVFSFFLMIVSLIVITQTATIGNYKWSFSLGAVISFVGVFGFWSLSFPDKVKDLKKVSTWFGMGIAGLFCFLIGGVFMANFVLGASRPLKTFSGECQVEVYRTGRRNSRTSYRLLFPKYDTDKGYKIGETSVKFGQGGYSAEIRGDFSTYLNIREGEVPSEGLYPCRAQFEVKAIDTPFGMDYVLETRAF